MRIFIKLNNSRSEWAQSALKLHAKWIKFYNVQADKCLFRLCMWLLDALLSSLHPMFSLQRKSHRFCPGAPDLGVIFDQDPLRLTGFIKGHRTGYGASDFIRGTVPGTVPLICFGLFLTKSNWRCWADANDCLYFHCDANGIYNYLPHIFSLTEIPNWI